MKIEKVEKAVPNFHDKSEYTIHIRSLMHALNHGINKKKVHRIIKFQQNTGLKPYIDLNIDLRRKIKNDFFKLMNHPFFGKKYGKCEKT